MANPIVTITMDNGDVMKAELYPEIAPNTVNNFISLVKKGFYDGLIFHRVINGFMIQGGCPDGTGMGGPGYSIKGEFTQNRFKNDLKHTAGVLSMARAMHPNSAGSQFFIMHKDAPHLDGAYAAFGKITEGLDLAYPGIIRNYFHRNSVGFLNHCAGGKTFLQTPGICSDKTSCSKKYPSKISGNYCCHIINIFPQDYIQHWSSRSA